MPDAGGRKEPGAGRCQRSPEEPENRAREKSKEPEKPGRSPRSPEGAERKRGARRTTGPSSVLSPCFAGCPPVIGRSLADRWPVVGRLLRRPFADIPPVLSGFQAVQQVVGRSFHGLFSGRSPILSVGPAPSGPSGPLVRWSVGSIGAGGGPLMPAPCRGLRPLPASRRRKSVPPPGSAPDEECTRPEPPARMPTTEPLRAQNLLARTCPAWDISARNISAQNVPVRAISPLGRPAPDTFTQEAPLRPSLPGRSRTPPLRRETPRDGS